MFSCSPGLFWLHIITCFFYFYGLAGRIIVQFSTCAQLTKGGDYKYIHLPKTFAGVLQRTREKKTFRLVRIFVYPGINLTAETFGFILSTIQM